MGENSVFFASLTIAMMTALCMRLTLSRIPASGPWYVFVQEQRARNKHRSHARDIFQLPPLIPVLYVHGTASREELVPILVLVCDYKRCTFSAVVLGGRCQHSPCGLPSIYMGGEKVPGCVRACMGGGGAVHMTTAEIYLVFSQT